MKCHKASAYITYVNITSNDLSCKFFWCRLREAMPYTGDPDTVPELAFINGFANQQPDTGSTFYQNPGVTPYENNFFCQKWKIIMAKSFVLPVNGRRTFRCSRKNFMIEAKNADSNYRATPLTIFPMIIHHSLPLYSEVVNSVGPVTTNQAQWGHSAVAFLWQYKYKVTHYSNTGASSVSSANVNNMKTMSLYNNEIVQVGGTVTASQLGMFPISYQTNLASNNPRTSTQIT